MNRISIASTLAAALALAAQIGPSQAQVTTQIVPGVPNSDLGVKGPPAVGRGGRVVVPKWDRRHPHPHYRIFVPNQGGGALDGDSPVPGQSGAAAPSYQSPGNPPLAGYYNETPASLACIYGLAPRASGCDPNIVKTNAANATNPAKAIGIVAYGHDTTALADLQTFSTQFNLPAPNLTILYYDGTAATSTPPTVDKDVSVETSLDVQMAHAMSPNAPIILVEGPALNDLQTEDQYVGTMVFTMQQVSNAGGGTVSLSYGGPEFSEEVNYESQFQSVPNVVFFVSSGDDPSVSWPASSPSVIAVGGTGTAREQQVTSSRGPTAVPTVGQFKEEVAWDLTGGGYSVYFTRPAYQDAIAARIYNQNVRAVPDVAAVADSATGVWITCSSGCSSSSTVGWYIIGGTSVASPLTASMTANRGPLATSTAGQHAYIYSQIGKSTYFDVTRGLCGLYAGFTVTAGTAANPANQYDLCTGIGSPRYTSTP